VNPALLINWSISGVIWTSAGFNFSGSYDDVKKNELIIYSIDDGRKVKVTFFKNNKETNVIIIFETESTHPLEMQRSGWQSILENFKKYIEKNYSINNSSINSIIQ